MPRTSFTESVELHSIADRVEVAPGVAMPRLGLGTSLAVGDSAVRAMLAAFDVGYRLVDTSANYGNEEEVGRAVAVSGLPREELFITTKLEKTDQGLSHPRPALESSLRRLALDHVDLYLIHWPKPAFTNQTWQAMEALLHAGLTRSIGVSNFEVSDLEQLLTTVVVTPAVNQIKLNPAEQRRELHAYCAQRGIAVEAWAPVMRGHVGELPVLARVGAEHGKTPAQVALRWLLQKGAIAIPKSVHESRVRENADIYDFRLGPEDMRAIDRLGV
ncbi:MAG: aldo/keto reductase [Coriobacteriia bacterium]